MKERKFAPGIHHFGLTPTEMNEMFDIAKDNDYLCHLFLRINEQYQPIYKALDDRPECSPRVRRTE